MPWSKNKKCRAENNLLNKKYHLVILLLDDLKVHRIFLFFTLNICIYHIYILKDVTHLNKNGRLARPEWIKEYGYWALKGVADLLPWEYSITEKELEVSSFKKEKKCPAQNGFDLSTISIPCDEIYSGGPPKDGIPAIDNPQFKTAEQNQFLKDKDYVLGVNKNGVSKAYPIRIMNRHEVVNDDFGGLSVAVTYCPLCGSGLAFNAMVDGQKKTFGVSGLLYNSDVLLYDRATESLWSQIMMKAVSGKELGSNLELIPTVFTTWEQWKKEHPKTLVLSEHTGFNRNYNSNSYEKYEASPDLMFDVKENNNKLRKKEKVIGIEVSGKYIAYSFSFLKKIDSPYQSTFNGQAFLIYFDKKNETAWMTDLEGNKLPAITMYWFAWYAFHPQTEVIKKK